jgi:hypothetical protein
MEKPRTWAGVPCRRFPLGRTTKRIIPTWDPSVRVGDNVELVDPDGNRWHGSVVQTQIENRVMVVSIKLQPPVITVP